VNTEPHRRGSVPDGFHRPRPRFARWIRSLASIACIAGGVISLVRGVAENDPVWLWCGVGLVVLGTVGLVVTAVFFRRGL
jgi:hypothetical protein